MVNENEVRVGNWVDAGITGQLLFQIKAKDFHYTDFKGLRAIPLTPEILEKCGFSLDDTEDENHWYELSEKGILFTEGDKKGLTEVFLDMNDSVRVKYLHQLQNLYYSLTGEELTFKP